jgi:hypothetical protein
MWQEPNKMAPGLLNSVLRISPSVFNLGFSAPKLVWSCPPKGTQEYSVISKGKMKADRKQMALSNEHILKEG